jgi:DNA-binding XRE family transcriptional regulator
MPRKPKFIHPVRQVRNCLGHTQPSFAKLIGCSPPTIQRIESGTLPLSRKLAISILEATGADPVSLLVGPDAKAKDVMGHEYSKKSYDFYKNAIRFDEMEMRILLLKIFHQLQLLYHASNCGGKFKTYVLNSALQNALCQLASDFNLTGTINRILIDAGQFHKRIYRIGDLRKFSEYAAILGYKDDKSYAPDDLKEFSVPHGWITSYWLVEKPVLPPGADMKLRNATYILDSERPIPPEVQEALDQALYWEITEFRSNFAARAIQ